MIARPLTPIMTLVCAALSLACGELFGPDLEGVYVLRRVAADTLPAVLYTNDHVTVRVLNESLHFTSARRGTRITLRESQPLSGEPPTGLRRGEATFGFRVTDGRIEVAFDCPPNANCVAPPHLVLRRTADGLQADFALGGRVPLIYERLPVAF